MQKTSKITFIEQNRQQPTYLEYTRWDVTMANGEKWIFLAKGNFKKSVGDDITYEIKNQQQGTAKLVRDTQFGPQVFNTRNVQSNKDDVQKLIIRQSSASSAAHFYSNKNADEQDVLNLARMIEEFVYNG